MLHDAEVGVESLDESLKDLRPPDRYPVGEDGAAVSFRLQYLLLHVVDCPVGDVDAPWLDDTADHRQSLLGGLYVHLIGMERQAELLEEESAYLSDSLKQVLLAVAYQCHVIHEADVPAAEATHQGDDELVKEGQEEAAEELRGDVPDRHAHVGRKVEAALLRVQFVPQLQTSALDAVGLRHVHQGDMGDPSELLLVVAVVVVVDEPLQLPPEDPLVDTVEA